MTVPATDPYGPLFAASVLEDAVVATLKEWMPDYISTLETRTGRQAGSVPLPRSWQVFEDFGQLQGDQLPLIVVVSPGTSRDPELSGGVYSAWWSIAVGVLVTARDKDSARRIAGLYGAAVRGVLAGKPGLGGVADGFKLGREAYTDADTHYVGWTALLSFEFLVSAVAAKNGGPPTHGAPPLGQVQEVDIDAEATRQGDPDPPDVMHIVSRRAT